MRSIVMRFIAAPWAGVRLLALLVLPALAWAAAAQPAGGPAKEPAQVMLLGLFHFDNPGQDAVKYKPIDVMQPAHQAYLLGLAQRLAGFRPTKVLLEYPEQREAAMHARYTEHLAGRLDLPLNEIYQIGFRVARLAGHSRVYGFDVDTPPFEARLWGHLANEPAAERKLMELIATESRRLDDIHRTQNLPTILAMLNSPTEDVRNKGFYILLNDVAAQPRLFHGADASANWWHRNFRMYALVQLHAQPGERVLVIAGSGHTAVMRDFLRADVERREVDVLPYLQAR